MKQIRIINLNPGYMAPTFQCPSFMESSIKKKYIQQKNLAKNQYPSASKQTSFNISYNCSPISYGKNPVDHLLEEDQIQLDNHSSIDLSDNEQNSIETEKQIQLLENQINSKLQFQFQLLKTKLNLKQQQKINLLKQYRKVSTVQPLSQNIFLRNTNKNMEDSQNLKLNPLNSKKIKNKIIRHSELLQKKQVFTTEYFVNEKQNKKIIMDQKNRQNANLIRRMSEELKKIEFRKIQDMAQGKFHFLKKK